MQPVVRPRLRPATATNLFGDVIRLISANGLRLAVLLIAFESRLCKFLSTSYGSLKRRPLLAAAVHNMQCNVQSAGLGRHAFCMCAELSLKRERALEGLERATLIEG